MSLSAGGPMRGAPCFPAASILALAVAAALLWPGAALGRDRADHARDFLAQLADKALPYWFDTAQDTRHGGYVLADDVKGPRAPREKVVVSQARMVWGFSHAHRKGFGDERRSYLRAAEQGYRFPLAHFLDRTYGGALWATDLVGRPVSERKTLYGQAFVVFALVEYGRASGDGAATRHALDLFRVVQARAHDRGNGGWAEHFLRDWTPILRSRGGRMVAGQKSANAHLHWMEALTELYEATRDAAVGQALAEALSVNATRFYPADPTRSFTHLDADWNPGSDPSRRTVSYGHNVEFAWLMIRAEEVLGREPSWAHFHAYMQHALKHGFDHQRGGLYDEGPPDGPATATDKVWWSQAEMLAALTDALTRAPEQLRSPLFAQALDKLLGFLTAHVILPDGIWIEAVTADGRPKATGKAHSWKANYHDVRAIVKFVEAFAPARPR